MFGGAFGPEDHGRRMEVLLGNGDTVSAGRSMMWAPSQRRARSRRAGAADPPADASARSLRSFSRSATPGLIVDRANWMRTPARALRRGPCSRPAALRSAAVNAEAYLETLCSLAPQRRTAMADRLSTHRRSTISIPPGPTSATALCRARRLYAPRLARRHTRALQQMNGGRRGPLFDLSPATRARRRRGQGLHTGPRAPPPQRPERPAITWLEQAPPARPVLRAARDGAARAHSVRTHARRGTGCRRPRRPRRAARRSPPISHGRRRSEQPCSCARSPSASRTIASAPSRPSSGLHRPPRSRRMGGAGGAQPRRPILHARRFPEVTVPPAYRNHWAVEHGIMRQESSFDGTRRARSGARDEPAMPGTAQIEARRVGVPLIWAG